MDSAVYLIVPQRTKNDIGAYVKSPSDEKRRVLCKVKSVSMNEFYAGARKGLRPDYVLDMQSINYRGERYVEYNQEIYQVIRTFHREDDDVMEVYIGRSK